MFSKILGGIQTFFDYMCVAFSKAVTVAVVTLMAFCILGVVIGIPVKSFLDWKSDLEQKSFSDGYNAAARDAVSGVEKFYDEVYSDAWQQIRPLQEKLLRTSISYGNHS